MDRGREGELAGAPTVALAEHGSNASDDSGAPFNVYIPALDGVRGFAVLAVMLFQFQIYLQPDVWRMPLFPFRWRSYRCATRRRSCWLYPSVSTVCLPPSSRRPSHGWSRH